jgi:hypothetical protein
LDLTNAYFHRGYQLLDDGLVWRPFLTVSRLCPFDPISATPYFTYAGSFEPGDSAGRGRSGSGHQHSGVPLHSPHDNAVNELMLGVVFNFDKLNLDLKYAIDDHGTGGSGSVQEIGARLWVDLPIANEDETAIGIRPSCALYREIVDSSASEELYLEFGLEPYLRLPIHDVPVGISLPLILGTSPDGYYFDRRGSNVFFGYLSVGLRASVPLERFKSCYLTASIECLHLFADSVSAANGNDDFQFLGRIGVGFKF